MSLPSNPAITSAEPDTRGTFRLLVSCVTTLSLCAYTAVHLNIPAKRELETSIYLRKAK